MQKTANRLAYRRDDENAIADTVHEADALALLIALAAIYANCGDSGCVSCVLPVNGGAFIAVFTLQGMWLSLAVPHGQTLLTE